jgi:hypothetical protein
MNTTTTTTTTPPAAPARPAAADDYQDLTEELARYSRLANRLAGVDAAFQEAITELIQEVYQDEFALLQSELTQAEERIELLALRHPEWFAKAKTIKTPFGNVASRTTTKLDVPSEEATIALLELRGEDAKPFLRQRTYLSIESLEALDDAELHRLKVQRITTEKITIQPAKVDLGKAVKKGGAQ